MAIWWKRHLFKDQPIFGPAKYPYLFWKMHMLIGILNLEGLLDPWIHGSMNQENVCKIVWKSAVEPNFYQVVHSARVHETRVVFFSYVAAASSTNSTQLNLKWEKWQMQWQRQIQHLYYSLRTLCSIWISNSNTGMLSTLLNLKQHVKFSFTRCTLPLIIQLRHLNPIKQLLYLLHTVHLIQKPHLILFRQLVHLWRFGFTILT